MSKLVEVKVPDIGDFKGVDVIEVLVRPGDHVKAEDSLITLESDKATMEVPSPQAGTVAELKLKVGDKVSQGSPILTLATQSEAQPSPAPQQARPASDDPPASERPEPPKASAAPGEQAPTSLPQADIQTEVVVLGAGPGGYTAAFRAADLGKQVMLVERYPDLGGVCLNVGCIPSKALLHVAEVIEEASAMAGKGVHFGTPELDLDRIRAWKEGVVKKLTRGLAGLAKQRKVQVVQGVGRFTGPHLMAVETAEGKRTVAFEHAIIAAGSQATRLPGFPNQDPRVMDSTAALAIADVPDALLVIGGGIIGLEMATVYAALGSRVTVVELSDALMPGCDPDLVKPLQRRIEKRYEAILLNTRVTRLEPQQEGLLAHLEGPSGSQSKSFDRVLVAVGRQSNGASIGAQEAGVRVDERGFIAVDRQQRTNVSHIFAIGDIVGGPMLAHKATHEGKVAAQVIAGQKSAFDARAIPSVAYTDPEVAWAGLTETEARQQGRAYAKGVFPWAASGRSLALGRDEGMTKILFDPESHRILGIGIVGPRAGDLIAEGTLAIEMGADAEDVGLTIHPHPTLSETVAMAAEAFEGTITDLYMPQGRPAKGK